MARDWYKRGEALLEELRGTQPPEKSAALWALGQAGFAVKAGGKLLFFDLLLTDLRDAGGNSRRYFGPPFPPEAAGPADYVFCSHDHDDHLNLETLSPMALSFPGVRFVAPAPYADKLCAAGILPKRVIGAREGERISLGDGLSCVPVGVPHEQYLYDDKGDHCCLAYRLEANGLSILHAGDTVLDSRLVEQVRALGGADVALLPINGADWKRREAGIIGNMGPRDAADFGEAIGADLIIPYHFDMFRGNTVNPLSFAEYMQSEYGSRKFHILSLGERFLYMK